MMAHQTTCQLWIVGVWACMRKADTCMCKAGTCARLILCDFDGTYAFDVYVANSTPIALDAPRVHARWLSVSAAAWLPSWTRDARQAGMAAQVAELEAL